MFGGGGGLFGQPTGNTGGGGLFGQPTPAPTGGLFGAPAPQTGGGLFGGAQTSMGGIGGILGGTGQGIAQGNNATPSAGLFGAQQAPTFGGAPAQGGGGLFGGLQQQPAQQTSLFGQPQQPAMGGFGGAPQVQQNQGLFGQQQQGGLFGAQPQQPGAFGGGQQFGGLGQPAQTGLFGTPQPQQGGGGLFTPQSAQGGWNNQGAPTFGGGLAPFQGQNGQQVVSSQDDSFNDFNMDASCSKIEDAISCICWNYQQSRVIAVGTWEGKVRIYEMVPNPSNMNQQILQERKVFQIEAQAQPQAFGQSGTTANTILSIDWKPDSSIIFVGTGIDNTVRAIQMQSGQNIPIGQHNGPVIAVYWVEQIQMLASLSTDQTLKIWNLNSPGQVQFQLNFNHKPLVADFNYPLLMIGFAGEKLAWVDFTQLQNTKQVNYADSPLGQYSRLTCLSLFPNRDGFGIGSIDGRGHMSNLTQRFEMKSIMTFKAHKVEENINGRNHSFFFPVNAVQFNGRNNFFMMTAGGEGQMIFWDYKEKNKIKTFQFNHTPITAAKVSHDRQFIAYALGNDFSKGPDSYNLNYPTKLCVHYIPDNELRCSQR